MQVWDLIILGAGAAGLHCAATAAKRGKSVLVLDHAKQAGKKILISGGGRCNFTNLYTSPENFLSANPHFCKSALSRYTQWDFLTQVEQYAIAWHEKTLGQLFCDESSKQIVNMLLTEARKYGSTIQLRTQIERTEFRNDLFHVETNHQVYQAHNLVVATGGLSMPKLSASPFGYQVAEQFGHSIQPVRAGLVPFTLHNSDKEQFAELSGLATDVTASHNQAAFKEAMLFTHRGLSGPAILQISSYWQPGETLHVDLMPEQDMFEVLRTGRAQQPKLALKNFLQRYLPKRLIQVLMEREKWPSRNMADLSNAQLQAIADGLHHWPIQPNGTEGYRTAEVTIGGVNVDEVSSRTMESKLQPGLFFIGEVLDVTGWLGGYNFQWAWSSGWVCGESV